MWVSTAGLVAACTSKKKRQKSRKHSFPLSLDRCTTIIALLVAVAYGKASITVRVSQVCTLVLLHVAAAAQSSAQVEEVGVIRNYEAAPAFGDSRRRLISKGTGESLEVVTCWCNIGHFLLFLCGIGLGSSLRRVRSAIVSRRRSGRRGGRRSGRRSGCRSGRVSGCGGLLVVVPSGRAGGCGGLLVVVLGVYRGRGGLLVVVLGVSDGL